MYNEADGDTYTDKNGNGEINSVGPQTAPILYDAMRSLMNE